MTRNTKFTILISSHIHLIAAVKNSKMQNKANAMQAAKKDYVILVGGGIGPLWLAHDSIEDDGEPSTYPPTTTDPMMALRSTSHSEIQKILKATVKRYPKNQFRTDVLDTIVRDDADSSV